MVAAGVTAAAAAADTSFSSAQAKTHAAKVFMVALLTAAAAIVAQTYTEILRRRRRLTPPKPVVGSRFRHIVTESSTRRVEDRFLSYFYLDTSANSSSRKSLRCTYILLLWSFVECFRARLFAVELLVRVSITARNTRATNTTVRVVYA